MSNTLSADARALLFTEARTANLFTDKQVDLDLLRELYDLMKWGPTSMNSCPVRLCFLTTEEAKKRIMPALFDGNIARVQSAPIVAVLGHDMEFFEYLPKLFPHAPENKKIFENNETAAQINAFRNSTLQGAYFIIAARALGLDCGPMSGFDNARVDQEFFAGTHVKSNFLCTLGYSDASRNFDRGPRFEFEEVCQVL
ncbi:MAG: malonic semialdehyde reductase [Sneathiella sp.]|uniref:malonic semialdehyde reductase n=1 Tax=Sneathiella sp. TaxID=1964365 RepID=UPI0030037C37